MVNIRFLTGVKGPHCPFLSAPLSISVKIIWWNLQIDGNFDKTYKSKIQKLKNKQPDSLKKLRLFQQMKNKRYTGSSFMLMEDKFVRTQKCYGNTCKTKEKTKQKFNTKINFND